MRRKAVRVIGLAWVAWSLMDWFFRGAAPVEVTLSLLITLLIVYEIWFDHPVKQWLRRHLFLANTFELRTPRSTIQRLDPRGIEIEIAFNSPIKVETFNVRFVEKHSRRILPDVYSDAPADSVTVVSVTVKEIGFTYERSTEHDAKSSEGVTVRLRDIGFQKYPGESMRLRLSVAPLKLWSGFMSFQGFDADGNRQYARQPFSVVAGAMQHSDVTQAP
jgi:hypothetical protein